MMVTWIRRLRLRLLATFSRTHDRDLRDELESHLSLLEDEYRDQGIDPVTADERARLEFGNALLIRERSRDLLTFRWVEGVARDVGYALRMMRRNSLITVVVVVSLGLGIGANTAIFTVIDAFLKGSSGPRSRRSIRSVSPESGDALPKIAVAYTATRSF